MRHIQFLSFLTLFFCIGYTASAQRFEVPENYTLETTADYHKYDNDIIKCVNWMEKTPPKESNNKLKKAGDFLAEWLTGCPYVRFTQNVRVDAFLENSPQLRVYYMGGWARYALQNPGKVSKVDCCMAGIRCAVKVYKDNGSVARDPNMDDVAAADQQGKLKEWVQDRM